MYDSLFFCLHQGVIQQCDEVWPVEFTPIAIPQDRRVHAAKTNLGCSVALRHYLHDSPFLRPWLRVES